MNAQRMSDERLAAITEFYADASIGFMSVEVLQALKADRAIVERVEALPEKWRKHAQSWGADILNSTESRIRKEDANELESAIHPPEPKE